MEDDADRKTVSRPNAADAMAEIHAVYTSATLHRTIMNCEHHAISLSKRHNYGSRLHTRSLLRHYEFATREVFVGFG